MIPTPEILLDQLPAFNDEWELIEFNQSYDDIVEEMTDIHKRFRADYDCISSYFDNPRVETICKKIFDFCIRYLPYATEPVETQTSRSPAGIIELALDGYGVDCKHYSLFAAGILDSLRRSGRDIVYVYRFCQYKGSKDGHVFVVVWVNGSEVWIDPAPIAGKYKRSFNDRRAVPEKFFDTMALYRVSGINSETWVYPRAGLAFLDPAHETGELFLQNGQESVPMFTPAQLGIPFFQKVFANQNLIPGAVEELARNPPIWFTLDGQVYPLPPENTVAGGIVPKIPAGLRVNYATSFMGYRIPTDMPRPTVVDGKLRIYPLEFASTKPDLSTLSALSKFLATMPGTATNQILLANNKVLLNILMSATGALVNSFAQFPYANKLPDLSHYLLDLRDKDNFLEPTLKRTLAGYFLEGVGNALEEVGKLILKFIGIIPRTAFLGLLRLNVHGWANSLFTRIQTPEGYNQVRNRWLDIGGSWGDMHDAIEDGNKANRILGCGADSIGVEPASTSVTALLAAAAPVIAALAVLLKSIAPDSKAAETIDQALDAVQKIIDASEGDPAKLAELLNRDVVVPGGGTVGPNVPKPPGVPDQPTSFWGIIKANPIPATLIGLTIVGGTYLALRPKLKRRRRQSQY